MKEIINAAFDYIILPVLVVMGLTGMVILVVASY